MAYPDERDQSLIRPEWLSLVRHWERGLLLLLMVGLLSLTVNLLFPKPQAVISLEPYSTNLPSVKAGLDTTSVEQDAVLAPQDEAQASNSNLSLRQHSKSGVYARHPKKPAHPPITNLNTAKTQQLQLLPGIGPKMAERILKYRKANGGFKTVEQVMDVKGIGPKKFEKMKAFLKV